jgi:hypothetical protein
MIVGVLALCVLIPGYVLGAIIDLARAVRRSRDRGVWLAEATIRLAAAGALVTAAYAGVAAAESRSHWVDEDNDGMLDGFVNGAYDWTDLNGGTWAEVVLALSAVAVVGARVGSSAVRSRIPDVVPPGYRDSAV